MDKISELFFQTLTPEILSTKDYVDWDTINFKVKKLRREIALLQSLDKDNPINDLADLLNKEPKILKVLQLLIANTPSEIYFDTPGKYIHFDEDIERIKKDKNRVTKIAEIFVEMGLVEFLKEVKSVEDIVKGVLLGLEPNVRKNRRGKKLEKVIEDLVRNTIEKIDRERNLNLTFQPQMYVNLEKGRKKIDYVVLKDNAQVIGIEVNFYSTSGSKPSEVLERAYPEVQQSLKRKNIGFIVITDGKGWNKMKPVIETAHSKLKYLMNIKMAKNGELEKAILEMLNKVSQNQLRK